MGNDVENIEPRRTPYRPGRRAVVTTGAGVAAGLAVGGPRAFAVAPTKLELPRPGSRHRLGTVAAHLVDDARRDPWFPSGQRELMVQLWYPARPEAERLPRAPWMDPGAAKVLQRTSYLLEGYVTLPDTHAALGAAADPRGGPYPVIVYSPGAGQYRAASTALVEDLVSHGYVVVTIDHTYDSGEVEFPGGRVETYALGNDLTDEIAAKAVGVRVDDTRFVLAQLPRVAHRVGVRLDLARVAMFGHSLGGAATTAVLATALPLRAGVNMDGTIFGPVLRSGVRKPLLLLGSEGPDDDSWAAIWPRFHAWRRNLQITGTRHRSYMDEETLIPQSAASIGATDAQVADYIGPLALTHNGARAIAIQRALLRAYFDHHLRGHRPSPLLEAPSARYPELTFIA